MKIGSNNRSCCITKLVKIIVIAVLFPNAVTGIWDFTRPTNNPAQAALGGAFLGAAGALTINWLKNRGNRGHYGKRDLTGNVRLFSLFVSHYLIFSMIISYIFIPLYSI